MNDHVPTWILKETEESEKARESYYKYMGRKLREFDAEEKQASLEREKANNKRCVLTN